MTTESSFPGPLLTALRVDRTLKLSHLTLSDIPEAAESFVYLREAVNCYIQGLPQAAIALARSAVESPIRQAAVRLAGEDAVVSEEFKAVIDRYGKRILTPGSIRLAHKVRIAANNVLHQRPSGSDLALQRIEDARAVVSELTKRAPKRRRKH